MSSKRLWALLEVTTYYAVQRIVTSSSALKCRMPKAPFEGAHDKECHEVCNVALGTHLSRGWKVRPWAFSHFGSRRGSSCHKVVGFEPATVCEQCSWPWTKLKYPEEITIGTVMRRFVR